MTCRERLIRVLKSQESDRMPIRLWGVNPFRPRPDWEPLYELVGKHELDMFVPWDPSKEERPPETIPQDISESRLPEAGMKETRLTVKSPAGNLTQTVRTALDGSASRVVKHLIETTNDAKKWLSITKGTALPKTASYSELKKQVGERGLVMIGISEAMYSVQALMGSEVFGYWLYDERELLRTMIDDAYSEIERLVKYYLALDLGDIYGWVGPEVCIPPLASMNDFMDFVLPYDKRIIDLVHDAGKLTWIHCHGDMQPVLSTFIDLGPDCLNPIEPPPVGRITLTEAKAIASGHMCLEGNVEDGAFDRLAPREIEELTERTVAEGKPGGGFILCPTSSPSTWPVLQPRHAENYRAFVETAVRLRDY